MLAAWVGPPRYGGLPAGSCLPRARTAGGGSGGAELWCVCHSCSDAFVGQWCQAPNPCLSAPCKNAGTCHAVDRSGVADYTCSCRLGFSGPLCLTPQDNACLANPCRHGGTCDLLTLSEYKCRCPPGWSGEGAPGSRGCPREGWAGLGLPLAPPNTMCFRDARTLSVAGRGYRLSQAVGVCDQKQLPAPTLETQDPHPSLPL